MRSTLSLRIAPSRIAGFAALLRRGFIVSVSAGSTLDEVLRDTGFSRKYLEQRVQTIFLDGSVVDDPRSETVGAGSVIALSSALPGLAGAIFRRGNTLSRLRTPTPKDTGAKKVRARSGYARIKLFNLIAVEMGPELLRAGLIMNRSELEEELAAGRGLFEDSITGAELDGKAIDPRTLFGGDFTGSEFVFLRVERVEGCVKNGI